jgi:hypothetical protein
VANGDLGTRELVALRLRDAGFEVATGAKLLDLADQGIYEAKRLVRNRLVLANDVAAA